MASIKLKLKSYLNNNNFIKIDLTLLIVEQLLTLQTTSQITQNFSSLGSPMQRFDVMRIVFKSFCAVIYYI